MSTLAYGFKNLADVKAARITDVGVSKVQDAITRSVQEHNRQLSTFINLFCTNTTEFKRYYDLATAQRLQPIDENGKAIPTKTSGKIELAWPIQMGGAAWGTNWFAQQKMTVAEVERDLSSILTADVRWMRDHILAALYTNASWTYSDPIHGDLTIKGLANGDSDVYNLMTGADVEATDTHYLAQAAAIADGTNPLTTMKDELLEHPENSGEVIVFVPSSNVAAVKALTDFQGFNDPDVTLGANSDRLTGSLSTQVPGTVFGKFDSIWLVEWRFLPANYLFGVTTGGERPLAMREHVEAGLRGFNARYQTMEDGSWFTTQYVRAAGFGAWNRVGAVVQRVGNGTYAIPTNFTSPMP